MIKQDNVPGLINSCMVLELHEVPPLPPIARGLKDSQGHTVYDHGRDRWRYDAEGLLSYVRYVTPDKTLTHFPWERVYRRPEKRVVPLAEP